MYEHNLIFKNQIKIINLAKKYINNLKKKNIIVESSPLTYMTSWVRTIGYFRLKELIGSGNKGFFLFFLKDLFSISKLYDLEAVGKVNRKNKKTNIIISYCLKQNFDKRGNYYDEYFGTLTNTKKATWILISLDHKIPRKLKENIIIIKKNKNGTFSLIYLISIILKNIFKLKVPIRDNFFDKLSSHHVFSAKLNEIIKNLFKNYQIKNSIINYESIPFQNKFINTIKKLDKNSHIYCYLHCAAWPLQTELIYKQKKIDTFFVSGEDQKKVLIKYYSWPKKKIKVIPSLRFKKMKKNLLGGYIFLPIEIFDKKLFLKKLKIFFENSPVKSLYKMKARIHPLQKNNNIHRDLKKEIELLIKKNKSKFSRKKKDKDSIIFGNASGVCIQALEEGNRVFHFPDDINLDTFSKRIWKEISIDKINEGVFSYKIIKKNNIFKTSHETNKFNKYFLPLIS